MIALLESSRWSVAPARTPHCSSVCVPASGSGVPSSTSSCASIFSAAPPIENAPLPDDPCVTGSNVLPYIVPKGFIAVDGTSLTICDTDNEESWFTFMLIAHTQQAVIIPEKKEGEFVNVEVDVLAKMVERSLEAYASQNDELKQKISSLEARLSSLEHNNISINFLNHLEKLSMFLFHQHLNKNLQTLN